MSIIKYAYFCWSFIGAIAPPSPHWHKQPSCTVGAWLPSHVLIMPGTYTDEDTKLNQR